MNYRFWYKALQGVPKSSNCSGSKLFLMFTSLFSWIFWNYFYYIMFLFVSQVCAFNIDIVETTVLAYYDHDLFSIFFFLLTSCNFYLFIFLAICVFCPIVWHTVNGVYHELLPAHGAKKHIESKNTYDERVTI